MEGLVNFVNNLVLSSISNIMVFSMDFSTVTKEIFRYFRSMYLLNHRKFKQCDRFIFSQIYTVPYTYFWIVYFCCISIKLHNCQNASHSRNGILFWKLCWPTARKIVLHCKCLHTNYRFIIIFRCCYYTWKCVKVL